MNNYSEKFGEYVREGEKAAMALPNRGPMRFDRKGNVASEILEGYAKYGFYVLENFLSKRDLQDWQGDFDTMKANYPTTSDAKLDLYGLDWNIGQPYDLGLAGTLTTYPELRWY